MSVVSCVGVCVRVCVCALSRMLQQDHHYGGGVGGDGRPPLWWMFIACACRLQNRFPNAGNRNALRYLNVRNNIKDFF